MPSHRALSALFVVTLLAGGGAVAGVAAGAGTVDGTAAVAAEGTVTGTATWANGTPVTGATVRVYQMPGSTDGDQLPTGTAGATVTTNDSGGYALALSPGEYTVVVESDGALSEPASVTVRSTDTTTLDVTVQYGDVTPPPASLVTGEVRKSIASADGAGTVTVNFFSEEEAAVGVRSLDVEFATAVDSIWVEVTRLSRSPVGELPGRPLAVHYIVAGREGTVVNATPLVKIPQSAVDEGDVVAYQYRDGRWREVTVTPAVADPEVLFLEVDATGTGYLAVVAETTTTTATPWTSTGPPPTRSSDGVVGDTARGAMGVLALLAAGVLAIRDGAE